MNKQTITGMFTKNYTAFITYINSLPAEEYTYRYQQKWTAEEQIAHIILCVQPLIQVLSLDKATIEKMFGTTDRVGRSYEVMVATYKEKTGDGGGKAQERFVPPAEAREQRQVVTEKLANQIQELNNKIENFTEDELDHLQLPHPLLGAITMREMLYNAIYHVEHHQELAKKYLSNRNAQSENIH